MKNKKHGNRALTILILLICAAIVLAIGWAVVTGLAKLSHYSENTTIGTEENPDMEVPGESMDNQPQPQLPELPLQDVPKNEYEPTGFYERQGLKRYESPEIMGVAGVDVSAYQGEIDWKAAKEAGVEFAMIRVGYRGYSTGKLDEDDYYVKNIQGALDAGIQVGVYFFSQALTEEEAKEEAQYVIERIQDYEITYPVVFDWEEVVGQARTDEMNMLMLTSCAKAFCEVIKEAGYEPGIYFNMSYGYEQLNLGSLKDYTFWLAEYADAPTFAYNFQMWQYTNEGTVPGIETPVDLNICFKEK